MKQTYLEVELLLLAGTISIILVFSLMAGVISKGISS